MSPFQPFPPERSVARTKMAASLRDMRHEGEGASTKAADPSPRLIAGRYRLRRQLGEGARKRVYLASDERLEREIAVALIKADGLDEAGLVRVRREAHSMAQLGDHP